MRGFAQFTSARKDRVSAAALALALGLLSTTHVTAELLFHDGFDYAAREKLGEAESESNPPWENSKDRITIASGSLNYPGLEKSTGHHVRMELASPSLDSVRTAADTWPEQSSGTLYVSFLLRIQGTPGIETVGDGTSLLTVSRAANNSQLLGINLLNDGALRLGVLKYPSSIVPVSSSAFFSSGPGANLAVDGSATYLIVAKYEWVRGASNDIVTLWVNPTTLGTGEDAGNQISTNRGTDGTRSAGRLILSRGASVSIDELRIGKTWADVTPADGRLRQLILVASALGCGLLAAGLWITLLRRKVEERSLALGAQIHERQRAEQQRLMEQERARIARDLHDELGADITEISMLATRAQGEPGVGNEGRQCLDQVADKTRQMVSKLEEIVWAMNPQHDSLGALVSYLSFFADRFLGLANIKLVVEASPETADLSVEARVRHQLFLVFKEALANVVRHSGASEVRLLVRVEDQTLHATVADNGSGFRKPDSNEGGHDGIANMRRRMEKLGGQFEIVGEPGQGTTVTFSAPLNS